LHLDLQSREEGVGIVFGINKARTVVENPSDARPLRVTGNAVPRVLGRNRSTVSCDGGYGSELER
jgi:hypothetical protein